MVARAEAEAEAVVALAALKKSGSAKEAAERHLAVATRVAERDHYAAAKAAKVEALTKVAAVHLYAPSLAFRGAGEKVLAAQGEVCSSVVGIKLHPQDLFRTVGTYTFYNIPP